MTCSQGPLRTEVSMLRQPVPLSADHVTDGGLHLVAVFLLLYFYSLAGDLVEYAAGGSCTSGSRVAIVTQRHGMSTSQ